MDWVAEKQAENITLLDVQKISLLADYFILCSGTTERQLGAIADEVREQAQKAGATLLSLEGEARAGWLLLDYGDVIVHILSPELRAYYRLEELWRDSNVILRMP
ncbi:MAG: ribosome silencing factor [Anaerolineae bacterium]